MITLVALGGFLVTVFSYILGFFSLIFNLPEVATTIWRLIASLFGG